MKLNIIFLSCLPLVLVGCAHSPTVGDNMITSSQQTKELGNNWNQGTKLIANGEALQVKGKNLITKGDEQLTEGRAVITKGEDMVRDGRNQVLQGHKLQQESELSFNQSHPDATPQESEQSHPDAAPPLPQS
jgi:hypothetical protein